MSGIAVAQGAVIYDTDPPFSPSVSGSPFTYTADKRCVVWFWGGTLTLTQIQRGSGSFMTLGLLGGGNIAILNPGDSVRLTYLTPPSMVVMNL